MLHPKPDAKCEKQVTGISILLTTLGDMDMLWLVCANCDVHKSRQLV